MTEPLKCEYCEVIYDSDGRIPCIYGGCPVCAALLLNDMEQLEFFSIVPPSRTNLLYCPGCDGARLYFHPHRFYEYKVSWLCLECGTVYSTSDLIEAYLMEVQ